jgi:hypothetical protein
MAKTGSLSKRAIVAIGVRRHETLLRVPADLAGHENDSPVLTAMPLA